MKTNEIFDSLTKNAIDFIDSAISEIKTKPKYSAINFYTAVELFIKARLLKEHWSLIFVKPENAEVEKFLKGDFQSVGLDDTVKRLQYISGEMLTDNQLHSFHSIREHRNKLIHFYNAPYLGSPKKEAILEVISEQCKAWFYLHDLLAVRWQQTFINYKDEISRLDKLMHSYHEYWEAKLIILKPTFNDRLSNGGILVNCLCCCMESAIEKKSLGILIHHACPVCEFDITYISVSCPICNDDIAVYIGLSGAFCFKCQKDTIQMEDLKNIILENQNCLNASCSCCGGNETVIPLDNMWLCLSCFVVQESISQCPWCSQRITGDSSGSYLDGCTQCDGRLGQLTNKGKK
jgi:hypothetical protein